MEHLSGQHDVFVALKLLSAKRLLLFNEYLCTYIHKYYELEFQGPMGPLF